MSNLFDRAKAAMGSASFAAFRARARRAQAYAAVYASPEGKFMIEDLLRKGHILEAAPAEDSRFYEGRRSLALEILNELRWSESEMVHLAEQTTTQTLNDLEFPQ